MRLFLLLALIVLVIIAGAALMYHAPVYTGGAHSAELPRKKYPIIHISGPSGSGKSTLGKKLADAFGAAIVIKDTDDLLDECLRGRAWSDISAGEIQRHIDNFISVHNDRTIVITGLLSLLDDNDKHYSVIPSTHKFYIDVDDATVVRQKCTRFFGTFLNDTVTAADLVDNNAAFLRQTAQAVKQNCTAAAIIRQNARWAAHHRKNNYIFAPADKIYDSVAAIIAAPQSHPQPCLDR